MKVVGVARRHPIIVISLITAVLLTTGTAVWAVNYDEASSQKMLEGTTVGGVAVGGLRHQTALDRVRSSIEDPLRRPIRVNAESFQAQTTAWDLGLRVDVPTAVRTALQRSNEGNLVQRVWRRLFGGGSPQVAVTPQWGDGEVSTLLERAAKAVDLAPRDAKIDTSSGWVTIVPPKDGRRLDLERSRAAVVQAAKEGRSTVDLVTETVKPAVGQEAVQKVILVRTGENTLHLYENGRIVKSWPVATGAAGFPTPTGIWRVNSKLTNPTWINPRSAWSANMPATIPPGPNNPLGTKALALSAPGILIHATPDRGSVGYSVSHGCIRMTEADEADLFGRVNSGTPVAIVNAGPPKPRPANPAPAPTGAEAAVTNF
jgi:lipoprotein-anchoring transpeptidase ErfK/SrfK